MKVDARSFGLVPPGDDTTTDAVSGASLGGTSTLSDVFEMIEKPTGVSPTVTALTADRFNPVTVVAVVEKNGPLDGDRPVTIGAPTKLNESMGEMMLAPPGVVTMTSTVPAGIVGVVTSIVVELMTSQLVPGVPPKVTLVAPVKPVPVTVSAL